jgi:hypothetical protein
MGSVHHPHRALIFRSIEGTIDNAWRNGGVVAAAKEAHRLATTYPDAGMSEAEILAEFVRLATARGVLVDGVREPEPPAPGGQMNRVDLRPQPSNGADPAQDLIRSRIWESIRQRVQQISDGSASMDARRLAVGILAEFPGSGLDENQVAVELHRIRRALRDRPKGP